MATIAKKNFFWRPLLKLGSPKYHRQKKFFLAMICIKVAKKIFFGDDSIFHRQKINLLAMIKITNNNIKKFIMKIKITVQMLPICISAISRLIFIEY